MLSVVGCTAMGNLLWEEGYDKLHMQRRELRRRFIDDRVSNQTTVRVSVRKSLASCVVDGNLLMK